MPRKELSRREETTIKTTCLFEFPDGSSKEIEVSHFMPQSEADIELGCNNRYESEWKAIQEDKDLLIKEE